LTCNEEEIYLSSEVYARVRIKSQEELHQQLVQELEIERLRQAELFNQMMKDIKAMKSQIENTKKKDSQAGESVSKGQNTVRISNVSNVATGEKVITGFDESKIEDTHQISAQGVPVQKLLEIDLSEEILLANDHSDKTKKAKHAQVIYEKIAQVPFSTEEELEKRNQFVKYINSLLADETLDFAYFKTLIDKRFEQLASEVDLSDASNESPAYFQYLAICKLLGVKPEKIARKELAIQTKKLTEQLFEKKKDKYVLDCLKEVFAELGMHIEEEIELDGIAGQKVVDSEIDNCVIFMSQDQGGLLFETIAENDGSTPLSSDQKARMVESANKICKKHHKIIELLKRYGIVMSIECEEKPSAETMRSIKKNNKGKARKTKAAERKMGE